MNSQPIPTAQPPIQTTERAMALVRGELSSTRRWIYRCLLVAVSLLLALLSTLWATEPDPLPMRTHIAFGVISTIATGWIAVLTTILIARNCPSAIDRLATAWMATVASSAFCVGAVAIAVLRENWSAVGTVLCTGAAFVVASVLLLRSTYAHRRYLQQQVSQLTGEQ